MTDLTLADLLFLVRAEFLEIPSLQLTQSQIEHLWGIDKGMAGIILSSLVEAHFLTKTPLGTYTRRSYTGLVASQMSRFAGGSQGRAVKH